MIYATLELLFLFFWKLKASVILPRIHPGWLNRCGSQINVLNLLNKLVLRVKRKTNCFPLSGFEPFHVSLSCPLIVFTLLIHHHCSFSIHHDPGWTDQQGSLLFCPGVMVGPSNTGKKFFILSRTAPAYLPTKPHSCQNTSVWWPVHIYESYIYNCVHPQDPWITQEIENWHQVLHRGRET